MAWGRRRALLDRARHDDERRRRLARRLHRRAAATDDDSRQAEVGGLARRSTLLLGAHLDPPVAPAGQRRQREAGGEPGHRSEEHTSELQSLMRISYAVFCLKKK